MIRAVIVDDETAVFKIIEYFIVKESLPIKIVATATDGEEGLRIIQNNKPDLVFIDIQMPKLNGFEVIRKYKDTNYIIITAFDFFEYAQKAIRIGAKDIILKPIEYNQIIQSIERILNYKFTNNPIINEILEYIHRNYYEDITLKDLSKEYFMESSNLARLFKNNVGVSLINYLHKVRINKAKELLEDKEMEIKDISTSVGYNNINNFYKKFKELTNMTPIEYRNDINGSLNIIE